ncbi:MAG: AMP-binding protein [Chloroflexi bacterium]|nr:AMP-binding protein [Chloroflexota bacterium]
MVINLFKPKDSIDPGEELIRTSTIPLTIPGMLADARARFAGKVTYRQKIQGKWEELSSESAYQQAQDFAAGLVALGHEKGDRVAIICENGLPWVVGAFGNAIAGGVWVPLYIELGTKEVEELVKRSGAKIVIISAKALERLEGHLGSPEHVIVVGSDETKPGKPPGFLRHGRPGLIPFDQVASKATDDSRAEVAKRVIEPEDLATIIFTSGTTGGMKGVMLTHKNLMTNAESTRRKSQAEEKDRLLLVLPMHHAFPFIMFLTSTAAGLELTFENDLLRVSDRLQEVKPTLFIAVPALFEQMYRTILRRAEQQGKMELFKRGLRVVDVAKRRIGVNLGRLVFREVHQLLGGQLRYAFSGGAALKPEVAQAFFKLGLPVLQGYGLTEASPCVAGQTWNRRKFLFSNYYEDHVGSVGTPVDGVEVDLIDVPEKEIYVKLHGEGELVIRGPNVFAGYWQAPEETARAMAGDWLRTGDLARLDKDGNIYITGRSKYVIVLDSGEKVVPDEIEDHIGAIDIVEEVCVLSTQRRNKTQVGAIVYPNVEATLAQLADRGDDVKEATIRAAVQQELDDLAKKMAPYKRVSELMLSDRPLPKTALRDIARGMVAKPDSFDVERWKTSVPEEEAPSSEPEPDQESAATA